VIAPAEARRLALEGLAPLAAETVPLAEALGRAAATPLRARRALPGFTNSAMDGYAVRHDDLVPGVRLRVAFQIPAGTRPRRPLGPGEAARIYTGAPMPEAADTVVVQEHARRDGDDVVLESIPHHGANVRRRGEDVVEGDLLVHAGAVLHPGRLAMLAAQGQSRVAVGRRPVVAVVPNGEELVPIDVEPAIGQVPDTNALMLCAQVMDAGGVPLRFDPVPDDLEALTRALREAAARADLVLTTGGMSVGDFDHARAALGADGALAFHKVRLKPGKPLGLGRLGGVPVLGLPGNPVSAFVGFELFGRPMVRTLAGFAQVDRPHFQAPLAGPVRRNRSRPEYVRCALVEGRLHPWPRQGSAMMSSLLQADALACIPMGEGVLPEGEVVAAVNLR
jgi:molybdopterin molybdotransferase